MNRLATLFLSMFLFGAGALSVHAQEASVKDTVLANERGFSELQIQRKCEEAAQLLAEDFQGTGGPTDSKSDFLNTCKTGELITTAEKFSNVEFRLNAPNTAVVAYLDDGDFILNNKPIKVHMYIDSVWVKHGSKWLMHLHTSSSIPFAVTEEGRLKLLYFDSSDHLHEGAGQKEKDAEKELIQLEKQWAEAGVKGDVGFFERIAAADYVIVDCDGEVRNKQQEIAVFRQETQTSQTVEDMKVRVYGASAVIVGGFTITGTYAGQPNNLSGNFTDVWIRPNRTWQLVSTQTTCKPAEGAQSANLKHPENSAEADTLEKNKAVLLRVHEEVWSKGNLAAADELYDPNYVYHSTYGPDEKGLEVFKKGVIEQRVAFPDWNEHVVQIIAGGDMVVTRFISSGTHKGLWEGIPPTGKHLEVQEIAIHRLANGKIIEQWGAGDWDQAERQLGVTVPDSDFPVGKQPLPQGPPDSFFVAREKEVWEALKKKDKSAASRLLVDDFMGMFDFGFFTKSERVKQIDGQYTISDYTIEDAKVLRPSPTTALLLYKSTCKGTGEWADYCSRTYYISDLWVQRNGQWFDLFSQDTASVDPQDNDKAVLAAILSSEKQIVGALSRDDIESFGRLLPDDVVDIWTDGVHPKSEWLRMMEQQKKDGFLFRDFSFEDPKLVRLGPDQAILTAREIIHGLDKGKPFEDRLYTMACYVRHSGKWVPLVYQDTPIK